MPTLGDYVTVVNRTAADLVYVRDGRTYTLHPGDNPNIPWEHVYYAKNQNRLRGSINRHALTSGGFLVGVKGTKDPVDLIEQSPALELLERAPGEVEYVTARGRMPMSDLKASTEGYSRRMAGRGDATEDTAKRRDVVPAEQFKAEARGSAI